MVGLTTWPPTPGRSSAPWPSVEDIPWRISGDCTAYSCKAVLPLCRQDIALGGNAASSHGSPASSPWRRWRHMEPRAVRRGGKDDPDDAISYNTSDSRVVQEQDPASRASDDRHRKRRRPACNEKGWTPSDRGCIVEE